MARPANACAAHAFVDSRALAAGAMWRCRTASAPWAARYAHTSVIDAAGAIFVIGGTNYFNGTDIYFNDGLKSTDGGADRTRTGVVVVSLVSTRGVRGGT